MPSGHFGAHLNSSGELLSDIKLQKERIWYPNYNSFNASVFRNLSYLDTWKTCIVGQLYDFQLIDNSLLQFRFDNTNPLDISFAYYECPFNCLTIDEFLVDQFGADAAIDLDEGDFVEEYEQYLDTCKLKETVTPIRYDYDPNSYFEGLHPAAHFHFGHGSEIRLGATKVYDNPLSFVLMIIRQHYPNKWKDLLANPKMDTWCRNVRSVPSDVPAVYIKPKDKYELYLT